MNEYTEWMNAWMHRGEDGSKYCETACNEASTGTNWRKVLTWEGVFVSVICFPEMDTMIKYDRPEYDPKKNPIIH